MIVILCKSKDNYAQNIIEWLKIYDCEYVVVDLDFEFFFKIEIIFKRFDFKIKLLLNNGMELNFNEISYFLCRSGSLKKNMITHSISNEFDNKIADYYLNLEKDTLIDFIYEEISKKSLGFISQKPLNKLIQIRKAQLAGILVPDTFITNSKKNINKFTDSTELITKAIQENIGFQDRVKVIYQRVKLVKIKELPFSFFPSLFQKRLIKELEIRTFYLDNKFYSIAIYNSEQVVDMRDYYHVQNHFKFQLPKELELKLTQLMKTLNLVSGSIDLILSDKGEFYFLEVNPAGQYDWVSVFGSYNLDEKIAKFLNKHEENNKKINKN